MTLLMCVNLVVAKSACVYDVNLNTGPHHDQVLSSQDKTSHFVTDAGISRAAETNTQSSEARSSHVTTDAVVPPDQAVQSSEPAAEAVVEPQAPVLDAASSQTGIDTESVQHREEPAGKLSLPETEHNQQIEYTLTESTAHVNNAVDEQGQPAVDSEAGSHHQRVTPAAEPARKLSPAETQEAEDILTESTARVNNAVDEQGQPAVDSEAGSQHQRLTPAAEPARKLSPAETEHRQQIEDTLTESIVPVINAVDEQGQPAVDSEAGSRHQRVMPAVDESVSDDDSELSHHESVSDHIESVDSRSDHSTDRSPQASDSTVQHDDYHAVNEAEQSQLAAAADVKRSFVGEPTEEQNEQLMPGTIEPADDQGDSEQHIVSTDEVLNEPDVSADQVSTSEDIDVQLNSADSEDVTETTSDERFKTVDDEHSVVGYLAPLVNLWAAVDAGLMTCIDSVSGKCVSEYTVYEVRKIVVSI